MTALFICSSVLGWSLWIYERRKAARRYGKLICDHRNELARHGMRRFAEGLNLAKERARMGRDWQEAAHAPTTAAVVTRMTL